MLSFEVLQSPFKYRIPQSVQNFISICMPIINYYVFLCGPFLKSNLLQHCFCFIEGFFGWVGFLAMRHMAS